MAYSPTLLIHLAPLLLCLAAGTMAAPPEPQTQKVISGGPDADSVPYTEAIPSSDFTLSNISSTIEEILAEAGALQGLETQFDHEIRYCIRFCY